ncbi:hypothetical protein [Pseudopelagicola sp. nBUS_19]|uniref:hypothetical protein n=1 Tax=Pseudopelagicola sp. nBUS_19 TaxID=3395316 RepID=UPI003EBF116E
MSMLAFDPWAALKDARAARKGANLANLANPIPQQPPRLAGLAGFPGENESARLSEDRSLSRLKGKLNTVNDVQELSGFLYRQAFDPTLPDWTKKELAAIRLRGRQLACPAIPEINGEEI